MNRQSILAFVLCGIVVLGFQVVVFGPQEAKRRTWALKQRKLKIAEAKKREAELVKKKAAGPGPAEEAGAKEDPRDPKSVRAPEKVAERFPSTETTLAGKEITARLSSHGASLETLTYNEIQSDNHKDPFTPLHVYHPQVLSLGLSLKNPEVNLATANWKLEKQADALIYSYPLSAGRRVEKIVEITDEYHLSVELRFVNEGDKPWSICYTLNGPAGMVEENTVRAQEIQGVLVLKDKFGAFLFDSYGMSKVRKADDQKLERISDIEDKKTVAYAGLQTKYFASLIMPADEGSALAINKGRVCSLTVPTGLGPSKAEIERVGKIKSVREKTEHPANQLVAQLVSQRFEVEPGKDRSHRFMFYSGPKGQKVIGATKAYEGRGLDKLIKYGYGFFATPALLLDMLLHGIYALFGNYGITIIVMTLIVRAGLHPLNRKMRKSTYGMQKAGPELAKIKEKYEGKTSAEARQKMAAETFEVYRKYEANPAMGCLPMVVQMPIIFALYSVIGYTYELRHANFLWINDLAQPDRLFTLPFKIPFHGTDAFSVLPIVMVFLYVGQQAMQPKPTDPKQAEMQRTMRFMMPVFGFMFYSLPSGLVLYIIATTIFGMSEQWYIERMLKRLDAAKETDLLTKPATVSTPS